jgi:hypothetical protein
VALYDPASAKAHLRPRGIIFLDIEAVLVR